MSTSSKLSETTATTTPVEQWIHSALGGRAVVVVCVLLFVVVMLRTAWVSEDAYITLRTVDNLVNGDGLRWNVAERVQAYTHPLWMLLLSAVYLFTGEAFYTTLVVSMIVSLGAVLLYALRLAGATLAAVLGVVVLTLSKAFMDYSTSGLENPLTHLLLLLFLGVYLKPGRSMRRVFWLSLVASAGALCRPDTILLYLPALVWALVELRRAKAVLAAVAGFVPLVLWECFSLFYYGFALPNTAYAKLGTGVAGGDLWWQGMLYLLNSIAVDPLTLWMVAAGLALPFVMRRWRLAPVAAGMGLYLIYMVSIGGDFMSGRYLTGPLLCAVVVVSQMPTDRAVPTLVPIMALALLLGLVSRNCPIYSDATFGVDRRFLTDCNGIADERAHYYQTSGLLRARRGVLMPAHPWVANALKKRDSGETVMGSLNLGYFGYHVGREVHVVDLLALADPLLSRLPARERKTWRIGHFDREVPAGYIRTLRCGRNVIADPNLASYYDKIRLVTRGRLLKWQRLVTIWRLNTGQYDDLLDAYVKTGGGRQGERRVRDQVPQPR